MLSARSNPSQDEAPQVRGFVLRIARRYGRLRGRTLVRNYSSGTSSSATMLMILISGLMAGPAVSL